MPSKLNLVLTNTKHTSPILRERHIITLYHQNIHCGGNCVETTTI